MFAGRVAGAGEEELRLRCRDGVGAGTRTGVGIVIGTERVVGCGVETWVAVISRVGVGVASGDGADWLQPPRNIATSARQQLLTRSVRVELNIFVRVLRFRTSHAQQVLHADHLGCRICTEPIIIGVVRPCVVNGHWLSVNLAAGRSAIACWCCTDQRSSSGV